MTLLSIDNLGLRLPGAGMRPILDGVDLTVGTGEIVGLVGESGSGKSVTARAVLGLTPRASVVTGDVRVDGIEVTNASTAELRRLRTSTVSMVFQDPRAGINPIRRVGDFMTESVTRNLGWKQDRADERATELLTAVGMPDPARHLGQHPHELSGGMLQRVMIAAALMTDPGLLLCDEPTTALDVTTQAEILSILTRLQASRGMGMLFITHDLDLAAAVCDRVYVMYAGRVVEHAPAAELFAAPRHPYTAGLLASTPDLARCDERLVPIIGSPLSLSERPTGCSFEARCSFATDQCREAPPALEGMPGVDASRNVACFRTADLAPELSALGRVHHIAGGLS